VAWVVVILLPASAAPTRPLIVALHELDPRGGHTYPGGPGATEAMLRFPAEE